MKRKLYFLWGAQFGTYYVSLIHYIGHIFLSIKNQAHMEIEPVPLSLHLLVPVFLETVGYVYELLALSSILLTSMDFISVK